MLVPAVTPPPPEVLRPLTDAEERLRVWLAAERAWRVERAQELLWAAEEAQRQAELAEKIRRNDVIIAAHEAHMAEATGLRRVMLELHAPMRDDPDPPYCGECSLYSSNYEVSFPCNTYVPARDSKDEA